MALKSRFVTAGVSDIHAHDLLERLLLICLKHYYVIVVDRLRKAAGCGHGITDFSSS